MIHLSEAIAKRVTGKYEFGSDSESLKAILIDKRYKEVSNFISFYKTPKSFYIYSLDNQYRPISMGIHVGGGLYDIKFYNSEGGKIFKINYSPYSKINGARAQDWREVDITHLETHI